MGKAKQEKDAIGSEAPVAATVLMAMNPIVGRAWADFISESARFMTERLAADLEMQKSMLACKDASEMIELQTNFIQTAMAQYSDEAAKLFEMTLEASGEIAKDAVAEHAHSPDDVPV